MSQKKKVVSGVNEISSISTDNLGVTVTDSLVAEIGNIQGTDESTEEVKTLQASENPEVLEAVNDTPVADGLVESEIINRPRRDGGAGSVYPISGGKTWGICIQLEADKEIKKRYGNKLRYLKSFKTYDEALAGVALALENKDELLHEKLEKLGHYKGAVTEVQAVVENK